MPQLVFYIRGFTSGLVSYLLNNQTGKGKNGYTGQRHGLGYMQWK